MFCRTLRYYINIEGHSDRVPLRLTHVSKCNICRRHNKHVMFIINMTYTYIYIYAYIILYVWCWDQTRRGCARWVSCTPCYPVMFLRSTVPFENLELVWLWRYWNKTFMTLRNVRPPPFGNPIRLPSIPSTHWYNVRIPTVGVRVLC